VKVDVVIAERDGGVQRHSIGLPDGARIADALVAVPVQVPDGGTVAVFGRVRALDEVLTDGDRVEVCQPLRADPKQARRSRARMRRPAAS